MQERIELSENLTAGSSVVVDSTNATAGERAQFITLAQRHGAHITGYFFDVTTRAAVART